ncbi:MAG: tetratricopeptide repeat protein [Myxococcota bacterium]
MTARRFAIVAGGTGVLVVAAFAAFQLFISPERRPQLTLNPDLSGLEAQAADRIQSLLRDVEGNPRAAEAWGRLGMSLDVHDFKPEAVRAYEQAALLDPEEFRWPYYGAIALHDLGSSESIAWFERSLSLRPNYAPLLVLYGDALFDAGRLEEASRLLRRALAADPQSSHAHLGLAQLALSRGDLQESRSHLERALEIHSGHGEAHGLLGEVYRRQGELRKAELELRKAHLLPSVTPLRDAVYLELTNEGVSSFWYRTRGMAYLERGQIEAAVREFGKALQARADAEAHDNLGMALQYTGRFDEAAEHHRAALALRPTYRSALTNLGTALFQLGELEEAIATVEKARHADRTYADAYLYLGTFHASLGRWAEAIDVFREGLANARYDYRIANRLAWLLATTTRSELRDGAEAVRLAETSCEVTGYRDPEALDALAAAYAETAQFDKAMVAAQRAHRLATSGRRTDLAERIRLRMETYESNRPYRERQPHRTRPSGS